MEELNKNKGQKYLIFSIGHEFYGTGIEKVREIIRFDSLTKVHDTQKYIRGVINLRGKIIPVMDLRLKLGLPFVEYSDKKVLIILEIDGNNSLYQLGLAVDAVHEVITPDSKEFEKVPELALKLKREYLSGIVKAQGRLIMILDINRVTSKEELKIINEMDE